MVTTINPKKATVSNATPLSVNDILKATMVKGKEVVGLEAMLVCGLFADIRHFPLSIITAIHKASGTSKTSLLRDSMIKVSPDYERTLKKLEAMKEDKNKSDGEQVGQDNEVKAIGAAEQMMRRAITSLYYLRSTADIATVIPRPDGGVQITNKAGITDALSVTKLQRRGAAKLKADGVKKADGENGTDDSGKSIGRRVAMYREISSRFKAFADAKKAPTDVLKEEEEHAFNELAAQVVRFLWADDKGNVNAADVNGWINDHAAAFKAFGPETETAKKKAS